MSYLTDYIYTLYDDINNSQTEVPEFDYSEYTEEQMYLEALYITETVKEVKAFVNKNTAEKQWFFSIIIKTGDYNEKNIYSKEKARF